MDRKELYELLDYFQSANISKLQYKNGEFEVSVSKAFDKAVKMPETETIYPSAHQVFEQPAISTLGETITAPLVGTFYSSPTPESEPFVKVGQTVKRGETLCILEAMKTLNELPAPFDCEIVEICAQNQEFVGFGQQLFVVKKV